MFRGSVYHDYNVRSLLDLSAQMGAISISNQVIDALKNEAFSNRLLDYVRFLQTKGSSASTSVIKPPFVSRTLPLQPH